MGEDENICATVTRYDRLSSSTITINAHLHSLASPFNIQHRDVMEVKYGIHSSDNGSRDRDSCEVFLNGQEKPAVDFAEAPNEVRQLRGTGEHSPNGMEAVKSNEPLDDV